MSAQTYRPPTSSSTNHVAGTGRTSATPAIAPTAVVRYAAAAARISLGWIFLWAFLDKTFGLGHETAARRPGSTAATRPWAS